VAKAIQGARRAQRANRAMTQPGRSSSVGAVDATHAATVAEKVMSALGEGHITVAIGQLGGVEPAVRAAALTLIAQSEQGGLPPLRQLAEHPGSNVAADAISAMGHLQSAESAGALAELARSLPRDLAKGARRSLARLAAAGVDVPPLAPVEPIFVATTSGVTDKRALLTAVDGQGLQAIFLAFTHMPAGSFVGTSFVHETAGLYQFSVGKVTQTELQRQWERWLQEEVAPEFRPVAVPYDYALSLVQQAADRSRQNDVPLPDDYESWTESAPHAEQQYDAPPMYAETGVDASSGTDLDLTGTEALLDEPEVRSWGFAQDAVESYVGRFRELGQSPILLSPETTLSRQRALYAEAATALFTDEVRTIFQRRLEVSGYVFLHSDRKESGRLAAVAAAAIAATGRAMEDQPFVIGLIERSIQVALEAAPEQPEGDIARSATATLALDAPGEDIAPPDDLTATESPV